MECVTGGRLLSQGQSFGSEETRKLKKMLVVSFVCAKTYKKTLL